MIYKIYIRKEKEKDSSLSSKMMRSRKWHRVAVAANWYKLRKHPDNKRVGIRVQIDDNNTVLLFKKSSLTSYEEYIPSPHQDMYV